MATSNVSTITAKYVFLDIVEYSRNRSVEAQTEIVEILNRVVTDAVERHQFDLGDLIYIPTGDGICVAILGVDHPYDSHLVLSLEILALIAQHNRDARDEHRKFAVRVGINENDDNQIIDINGNRNVAGAGINLTQRIMSSAGPNNIFLSQGVHDRLSQREKHMGRFVRHELVVKHGVQLTVFQYINPEAPGLSSAPPRELLPQEQAEATLDPITAFYFANLIRHLDFIKANSGELTGTTDLRILMWYKAEDGLAAAQASGVDKPLQKLDATKSLDEQLLQISSCNLWMKFDLSSVIAEQFIRPAFHKYLIGSSGLVVSETGIAKLQQEWPQIAKMFGLL